MCHVVALFSSLIWILHLFPDPLGITDKKLCVTIKEIYFRALKLEPRSIWLLRTAH